MILEPNDPFAQFFMFNSEFKQESPRGATVLAASWIDEYLKKILISFLVEAENPTSDEKLEKMFEYEKPLGPIMMRLRMAYYLGLLSEREFKDCKHIIQIRNKFGHRYELKFSFEHEEIAKICRKLNVTIKDEEPDRECATMRERFEQCILALFMRLIVREPQIKNKRLERPNWQDITFPEAEN